MLQKPFLQLWPPEASDAPRRPRGSRGVQGLQGHPGLQGHLGVLGLQGPRRCPRTPKASICASRTPASPGTPRCPTSPVDLEVSKVSKDALASMDSRVSKGALASLVAGRRSEATGRSRGILDSRLARGHHGSLGILGVPPAGGYRRVLRGPRGAVCPGKGTQGCRSELRHPRVASCKAGAPASLDSVLQGGCSGILGGPLARWEPWDPRQTPCPCGGRVGRGCTYRSQKDTSFSISDPWCAWCPTHFKF